MQLENDTPLPAAIFRTVIDDTRMAAAIVLRVTYDFKHGQLVVADDQVWPVSGPPFDGPQGPMDSDELFYRGGVDLFVFGEARPPKDIPVRELQVRVTLADFSATFDILGDRVWQSGDTPGHENKEEHNLLRPGPAQPFDRMPLTRDRAFGGTSEWDELAVPYPDNPEGVGFHLERDQALGAPLPNIEDPDNRIQSWQDRPNPVGTWPLPGGNPIRTRNGFVSADGSDVGLRPAFFNAAFPGMIAPSAKPGQWVCIDGMHPAGRVRFELPHPPLNLRLFFEPDWAEPAMTIDQIGVEICEARAFITYRYPFRYTIHRMQKRRAMLVAATTATPPR